MWAPHQIVGGVGSWFFRQVSPSLVEVHLAWICMSWQPWLLSTHKGEPVSWELPRDPAVLSGFPRMSLANLDVELFLGQEPSMGVDILWMMHLKRIQCSRFETTGSLPGPVLKHSSDCSHYILVMAGSFDHHLGAEKKNCLKAGMFSVIVASRFRSWSTLAYSNVQNATMCTFPLGDQRVTLGRILFFVSGWAYPLRFYQLWKSWNECQTGTLGSLFPSSWSTGIVCSGIAFYSSVTFWSGVSQLQVPSAWRSKCLHACAVSPVVLDTPFHVSIRWYGYSARMVWIHI